jgi:thiosulfate/3-mercaptopyruvate sulfurtransferase
MRIQCGFHLPRKAAMHITHFKLGLVGFLIGLSSASSNAQATSEAATVAMLNKGGAESVHATAHRTNNTHAEHANLVSAEWLRAHLDDRRLVLIDTAPGPRYAKQRIGNAHHYDFYRDGGRDLGAGEWQRRFQAWGISDDSVVVLYDEGGAIGAANLFFELATRGFPKTRLFVLDGGFARWTAIGGATVTGPPVPASTHRGNFVPKPQTASARVRLGEFLAASGDTRQSALIDALGPEYYFGGARFFDRGGHVPNASNIPSDDFFNADKTFKSRAEIERMMRHLGITKEQQVLSHCGGGVAATVPWFALGVLLDFPNVRVYRESQREWLQDERGLPFRTFPQPQVLREQAWLNSWNQRMLRGAGISRISVLDIREATAYGEGHIPYALNVPIRFIREQMGDPQRLAATLSAAGVNKDHEVVIVGQGGLNADAAIAFIALQKLGQVKLSILRGSMDDWMLAGFATTKLPTRVGAPTSAEDFAVAPTTYTASNDANLVPATSTGKEARIYVDATAPSTRAHATAREHAHTPRNAIHVSPKTLIQTDGSPKAAGEIWKSLQQAGISRYAELVSTADDVGDAALNVVLLNLMGFRHVRIQLTRSE